MKTIKCGRIKAAYSRHKSHQFEGSRIELINYKQQDYYSCGFVAALTVTRYYSPNTSARKVLEIVRPSINYGVNRFDLIKSLRALGIDATLQDDLTLTKINGLIKKGVPVIVSVWPEGWYSDHWTIVQGFDSKRVHLTNYGVLSFKEFYEQWSDMDMRGRGKSREGIVCLPNPSRKNPFKCPETAPNTVGETPLSLPPKSPQTAS